MKKSHFKQNEFKKYLIECIDGEPYEKELKTDAEKIEFLKETFLSEYGFMVERVGFANALSEYVSGLPSIWSVDFMNYKILELAPRFGMVLDTEKKEDDFLKTWWNRSGFHMANIMIKQGV